MAFALHRRVVRLPALGILTLFAAGVALHAGGAAQPNVLVILVDDLGWADISAHGSADVVTPHIDSIGANGVRFTAGYVTAPQCSPTRAGLLTGRYQSRFGHDNNNYLHACFAGPQVTIADAFQSGGYATGAFGKWHLGHHPHERPLEHGFTSFWGFLHGGHAYLGKRWQDADTDMFRNNQKVEKPDGFLTDTIADRSVEFMSAHQEEPWFAYVAFNAPHSPLQMPPGCEDRVGQIKDRSRARFVAMMLNLDDAIGRMLGCLRDTGQWENTMVVLLSDNGGQPHANSSINLPFRGNKGDVFEGGIRIPFMIQWPAHIPDGQVVDEPVISLDIMPTALAAAGLQADTADGLDGIDLLPALTKRLALADRPLFWRWNGQKAVRVGDWKWVSYPNQPPALFNLHRDPYETHDLIAQEPAKGRELRATFAAWDAGNSPLNEAHRDTRVRPKRPQQANRPNPAVAATMVPSK